MLYYQSYLSPLGALGIVADEQALTAVLFHGGRPPEATVRSNAVIERLAEQLDAYFDGKLLRFDLPLRIEGTPFQLAAWEALRQIPYGTTRTYAQIAASTGNRAACRAAGMACHRNPIPIVIPCHRVVGTDGRLTGYAAGVERKRYLLELEQRFG